MRIRLKILLIGILPLPCFAQSTSEKLMEKVSYETMLYLNNMYYGSQNPVSISAVPFQALTDLEVTYSLSDGKLHNIDQAQKERQWLGGMYGIRKLKKVAFEGGMNYRNTHLADKKWNATLFVDPENPFMLGDSLTGDYTRETFRLHGGFSADLAPKWKAALRGIYDVGSSADETDPRPDTKGMKFLLNPGISYQPGQWQIGLSAGLGWLSESIEYTVVKTYETYQVFLFQGLGTNEMKQAIGYRRKYKGNLYKGALQLGWDNRKNLANFLEAGYEKSTEEATDGILSDKYKGGKYEVTRYRLLERFQIRKEHIRHNITLQALLSHADGTWYIQKQKTDTDGNIIWEVKNASVCHKEDQTKAQLAYRMDILKNDIPHWQWEIQGSYLDTETKHYPQLYSLKYSQLNLSAHLSGQFAIRKSFLNISLGGGYQYTLSSSQHFEGLALAETYSLPFFAYLTADCLLANAEVALKIPLTVRDFHSWVKLFVQATGAYYAGNHDFFDNTKRQGIQAGLHYIF